MVDRQLWLSHWGGGGLSLGAGDVDRVDLAGSVSGGSIDRSSWGVVGRAGPGCGLVATMRQLGVGRSALIGDLGHVAAVGVRAVLHMLDPAVRESNGVGPHHDPGLVLALHLVELGAAVGVAHPVLVGVGPVGAVVVHGVVALHLQQ